MSNLTFNQIQTNKIPINRNNLFYSDESFLFEQEIGKQYVEMDMNQTVVLYSVDMDKTNSDALYGETNIKDLVFKTPIEIHCVYELEEPELKSYDKTKNLGTYLKSGRLTINVYQTTLDELGVDIRVGDYIGVIVNESHMDFFTVANDGRNNYDNKHTIFGTRPFYRTIICASVDSNEFNG